MPIHKMLRNVIHNVKDEVSMLKASLSLKRRESSIHVHVIRCTTHKLSTAPSEDQIEPFISVECIPYLLPQVSINALLDRLHKTHNATVSLKCLFILHNIITKGSLEMKDILFSYNSNGDHNAFNLSSFRDNTNHESLELSTWVCWHAKLLEDLLMFPKSLGYYLSLSNGAPKIEVSRLSTAKLLGEIQDLIDFVEHVSHVPESLYLRKYHLVNEVVTLVMEDCGHVQHEILWRVEEVRKRVGILDTGELREILGCMNRLEELGM
ncbi:hypothetical protein VNO77_31690 [Canavalia gladiata]|uniref:ENTH domain-containing protein n=1 Tax=Canavalia gladiata TaxID=3824 RepID=A0AAN9Q7U4_CANGL